MKLFIALALVALVWAGEDEAPRMTIYVGMTEFFQGRDVFMTCGPCSDGGGGNTVTMTIARCDSKDSCTNFYSASREKGNNEATTVLAHQYGKAEVYTSEMYVRYRKPNAQCSDEGIYRCECAGKAYFGNVNVKDC